MKVPFFAAALFMSAFTSPHLAAAEPTEMTTEISEEKIVEARAIVEIIYPVAEREAIFREMTETHAQQIAAHMLHEPAYQGEPDLMAAATEALKQLPEFLWPATQKHMSAIIEATAVAYAREFSLQELSDIRSFGETDSGRRLLTRMPFVLNDPALGEARQAHLMDTEHARKDFMEVFDRKIEQLVYSHPDLQKRLPQ